MPTKESELSERLIEENRPHVVAMPSDKSVHNWLILSTVIGVAALALSGVAFEKASDSSKNNGGSTACAAGTPASSTAVEPSAVIHAVRKNAVFTHYGNAANHLSVATAPALNTYAASVHDNSTGFHLEMLADPIYFGDAHINITDTNTNCAVYFHIMGNGTVITTKHACPNSPVSTALVLINATDGTVRLIGDAVPAWATSMIGHMNQTISTALSTHVQRRGWVKCVGGILLTAGSCIGCGGAIAGGVGGAIPTGGASIAVVAGSAMALCGGCMVGMAGDYC